MKITDSTDISILILPQEQSKFIYYISYCAVPSFLYGLYTKQYFYALTPGIGFITSINYWRHPIYSWRRNVDICFVCSSYIYNMFNANKTYYAMWYYTFACIAGSFYLLSWFYYNKKQYWLSTYSHGMVHVFGNIALCIFLYGAKIKSLTNLENI